MRKIAVFIDAGYVFAQGSVTLEGRQRPRAEVRIDPDVVIGQLRKLANELSDNAKILRFYWYDGAQRNGLRSSEHAAIARMDDVKLRLGIINSNGQQKGVDSLILTDLMELARLKSVDEALLVSGDGDLRVGIQIAQNHGVRVHLLGIHPARGSQSPELMDEADTTREWDKAVVAQFLKILPSMVPVPTPTPVKQTPQAVTTPIQETMGEVVNSFVATLDKVVLLQLRTSWERSDQTIPSDIDRGLLRLCYAKIGRSLDDKEKPEARRMFRQAVKALSL